MLDELLEYQQYTADLNKGKQVVPRLKYKTLITGEMSGLNRALTIIARHFLFDVYGSDPERINRTRDALKYWLGLKRPADDAGDEERELYGWLPEYIDRVLLPPVVENLRKKIRESALSEENQTVLTGLLERLPEESSPEKKAQRADELKDRCKELGFYIERTKVEGSRKKPQPSREEEAVLSVCKAEHLIYDLSRRKSFNQGGYQDRGEANDYNRITYDRSIANAVRAGKLKRYFLACDRSLIEEAELSSGRYLRDNDRDAILKLTACCMLELTGHGTKRARKTKPVHINSSDVTNWLILKKCEKATIERFRYKGQLLFEQTDFSGKGYSISGKKINGKKFCMNQQWLEDSGFEILTDDPNRDVAAEFKEEHPEGSVFLDCGAGVMMEEL